jgi:hypothetical protein
MEFLQDLEYILNTIYKASYFAKPILIVLGVALLYIIAMLITINAKLKKLKIMEAQLSDITEWIYGEQEGDNYGKHDDIYLQGDSSGS